MLKQYMIKGAEDACTKFGIKTAAGMMDWAKNFGRGQMAAGKDLYHNLRGGLGGKSNAGLEHLMESGDIAQHHRQQALGNLRTLAPSLIAAGTGAYLMGRDKDPPQQQQYSAPPPGYGGPRYY